MDKKKIGIIIGIIIIILALVVIFSGSGNDSTNYAGEIVDSEIDYKSNGDFEGFVKIDFGVSYPNSTGMDENRVNELKNILDTADKDELEDLFWCRFDIDEGSSITAYGDEISDISLENNILTIKVDGHDVYDTFDKKCTVKPYSVVSFLPFTDEAGDQPYMLYGLSDKVSSAEMDAYLGPDY